MVDSAHGNRILGNYIGTDRTGTLARGNGYDHPVGAGFGILLFQSPDNFIGGPSEGEGNLISGNIGKGVAVFGNQSTGNVIKGNFIGTDISGHDSLGNSGNGVFLGYSTTTPGAGAPDNTMVGGISAEDQNIIAFNGENGVCVEGGTGHRILSNRIFGNAGLGIDLGRHGTPLEGVTTNDLGDPDAGPNGLQNFPVLRYVSGDSGVSGISGTLNSIPDKQFRIQFFQNSTVDISGHGEGEEFLGDTLVTTSDKGNVAFTIDLPGLLPVHFVSATATDADGNTSEFSQSVATSGKKVAYGNHYVVNTTFSGVPLHWRNGTTSFSISPSVPAGDASAIGLAFSAWSALPQIEYSRGDVPGVNTWGGVSDGVNNIVWVPSDWTLFTQSDPSTIALTRVRYNAITGVMTDVDIAINGDNFAWHDPPGPLPMMDMQNVVTHEAGHFSGLGDIYDPGKPGYIPYMGSGNLNETMYGLIRSAGNHKEGSQRR